jgi:tRNA threonylcarbamoyladenosine biosynthesis protein TsaB
LNVLALDAAYGQASACLLSAGKVRSETISESTPHSQSILPMLTRLLVAAGLEWEQLDVLAVGVGPGSFTGIRVAIATVAGLNAVLAKPVLGVSSLAITARQADVAGPVWVLEDARAGEMFAACYEDGKVVVADGCHTHEALAAWPAGRYASHQPPPNCAGWNRLPLRLDRAEALAREGGARLDTIGGDIGALPRMVAPAYLQRSQAERNAAHG